MIFMPADTPSRVAPAFSIASASAQLRMGYDTADGVAGIEFQSFLFSRYGDYLKQ